MASSPNLPNWLETLLEEKFFSPCLLHESFKKNEKNIFCLDCCTSFCPHCLSPHRSHRLLRIRRYVYHDVVRLDDVENLIDCAYVQSYTTNSAKVIFLNQRPQTRPFRGSGNICMTCDRSLQDRYLFCSLACKVSHILRSEGEVWRYLYKCDFLPLSDGDGMMTPDSILESFHDSSCSSASLGGGGGGGGGGGVTATLACTATTEVVRKKRSNRISYRPMCYTESEIAAINNRRKSIPQRSPLY